MDENQQEDLRARHVRNLEGFGVRARRVQAHSLSNLARLEDLRSGAMTVRVVGTEQTIVIDLPPEEQMESLAARVRPVILKSEPTYWGKALEAIGFLAHNLNPRAVEVRKTLRQGWKRIDDKATDVRGYTVQMRDADGERFEASDNLLAWAWFYGDVVHASAERLALTKGFDVFDRYRAACTLVAEIAFLTLATLSLIEGLVQERALDLDPTIFDTEVTVTETRREVAATVYTAPVGTPIPTDIDAPLRSDWLAFGTDPQATEGESS
jgi:hypothetical protein